MRSCCHVVGCRNGRGSEPDKSVSLHAVPRDEPRRTRWLNAVTLCKPFRSQLGCKRRLRKDAVPSRPPMKTAATASSAVSSSINGSQECRRQATEERLQNTTTLPQLKEMSAEGAACGALLQTGAEHGDTAIGKPHPSLQPGSSPLTASSADHNQWVLPCSVVGCKPADWQQAQFRHTPPKSNTLRQEWLKRIGLPPSYEHAVYVCGRHFTPSDYQHDLGQSQDIDINSKKVLLKNTVPTLCLPNGPALPLPQPEPKLCGTSDAIGISAKQQAEPYPVTGRRTSTQKRTRFRSLLPKGGISSRTRIQCVKLSRSEEQEVPSVSGQQYALDDRKHNLKLEQTSPPQMENLNSEKTFMVLLVDTPHLLPVQELQPQTHGTTAAACEGGGKATKLQRRRIHKSHDRPAISSAASAATQARVVRIDVSTQAAKIKREMTTQAGTIKCQVATQTR